MKRTGVRIVEALLLVALAGLFPPAAGAAPTPYEVGAAKVDVTPPGFNTAQDLVDFPEVDLGRGMICPRALYSGHRDWRFEEPYTDTEPMGFPGHGHFSYPLSGGGGGAPVPEPFCDYNHNGRWDGIYSSGSIDQHLTDVHDPIDARAIAVSDGDHTVVIVSVVAQGLHENYLDTARTLAKAAPSPGNPDGRPGIDDVVISANHNESSPDTVGIYGGPDLGGVAGGNSGIDDYYYEFLQHRIAHASAEAFDSIQPASLRETEFNMPGTIRQKLSTQFPTTDDNDVPAAIDPKIRVLQARDANGDPIVTMMNLAGHNQEIGHDGPNPGDISADWPGYFHDKLEADLGGIGMFLVGDNGSMEDPETVPSVGGDQYAQAQATGLALADEVKNHLGAARDLSFGPVSSERRVLFVPLENNAFRAAAVAGLFGQRQLYTGGVPTGRSGTDLKTSVAAVRVGPDLQFLVNPGEAFPALMLGSPWGIDDPNGVHENVGCPDRPNPPVPTWHASATHRFQIGLGDDMIGYEIPAWAFTEIPGLFTNQPPNDDACFNDPVPGSPTEGLDPAGHDHKLEAEGVGPSASNEVAAQLTSILDQTPDPAAQVRLGRFVRPDGTLSRRAQGAVAVWLAAPGSTVLAPGTGTIVAIGDVGSFGSRQVDTFGSFMDFDGAEQAGPDVSTRGMLVPDGAGGVGSRYYVDVYPALTTSALGAASPAPEPAITIDDVSTPEGDSGSVTAMFTVSLSAQTGRTVTVDYGTTPGSAATGSDFDNRTGTLTFAPNDTTQTIGVPVNGDTADEPDEDFSLDLSNPVNATLADGVGRGTILDNDPTPPGPGPGGGSGSGGSGSGSGASVLSAPGKARCRSKKGRKRARCLCRKKHAKHGRRNCRRKLRARN